MNLQITFKNFDHTLSLDSLIKKKSKKLEKFFANTVNINWTCCTDSGEHYTEVKVSGFAGPEILARAKSENMYKTIDLVVKKLEQQLRKKRKVMNRKTKPNFNFMEAS